MQKYDIKKEIKNKVLEKLIELNVLTVPINPIQPMVEGSLDGDPSARPGVSSPKDDEEERVALATPTGEVAECEAPPATLPRFEPFSPESRGSSRDIRLKVRLKLEAQEKERVLKADYDLQLQVRRLEIEAERDIKLRELDIKALRISSGQTLPHSSEKPAISHSNQYKQGFDVSKHVALVPTFWESEVDSYFNASERIATALDWPKDMWPILLHCKLVGKAQEVVSSLSLEESLQYDVLKESILRAYELVPEAYRQKFRNHKKSNGQTFVEFA